MRYDAVIVGGGHNGLVCGFYLARAGLKVRICEARDVVGGAAVTETVFAWPGVGRLGVEAALGRDYPLVMAVTLLVSAGVLLASLLADVAQMMIDPRLRTA